MQLSILSTQFRMFLYTHNPCLQTYTLCILLHMPTRPTQTRTGKRHYRTFYCFMMIWHGYIVLFFVSEQIEMYFSLNCELDRFLTNITYTITWNVFYDTIFAQSLLSNVSVFRLVFFYNLQLGENGHWSTWNKESPNKCKWYSMPCK